MRIFGIYCICRYQTNIVMKIDRKCICVVAVLFANAKFVDDKQKERVKSIHKWYIIIWIFVLTFFFLFIWICTKADICIVYMNGDCLFVGLSSFSLVALTYNPRILFEFQI